MTLALVFCLTIFNPQVLARDNVNYWYIKDFQSTIEILSDDTTVITEDIVADCGSASKYGIFRILPTEFKTVDEVIYTPIELISITDFAGNPYKYQVTNNVNTVTWKIGDPQKTVSGVNNYRIKYKVINAIRDQANFDEFYWNLAGNYWDLEIDKFSAKIILPKGVNEANSGISLYSGRSGSQINDNASAVWSSENSLQVESKKGLKIGEGITLSLSFPKNFINHQQITKQEPVLASAVVRNSSWFKIIGLFFALYLLILPLIVLIIAYIFYRKEKKRNKYYQRTIVTEYDAPENISPIILGYLDKQKDTGKLITATIVKMAVLRLLVIKEQTKKVFFAKSTYLEFIKTETQENFIQLDEIEKYIMALMFKNNSVMNSDALQADFSRELATITAKIRKHAKDHDYLLKKNSKLKRNYLLAAIILFFTGSIFSAIILLIFYSLSDNLSEKGQKIYWQIQGFKHYLTVAEKEKHIFYEKENIFTKFLPYSIAIGNVKEWINKMKDIYSEEHLDKSIYWYVGVSGLNSLSKIDGIESRIDNISNNVGNSSGSSSGFSGSGFSGGGSGGGGGGGW